MVLILGNRRLRRFEWLLFALMAALFMWYAGNLLALNVGLFYGAGPPALSAFSRVIALVGFMAAVPLLVHVQVEYLGGFVPIKWREKLLVACFYLPVGATPWLIGRSLHQLAIEPMVALGWPVRPLVVWAVAALLLAVAVNLFLMRRRREADPTLARFHGYLAGLQGILAGGLTFVFVPHPVPPMGGWGYFLLP